MHKIAKGQCIIMSKSYLPCRICSLKEKTSWDLSKAIGPAKGFVCVKSQIYFRENRSLCGSDCDLITSQFLLAFDISTTPSVQHP